MSKRYLGKTCPYCKTPFTEGETVVFCSICEMPHHLSCWRDNQGCTTFGCTGIIQEIVGMDRVSAPTPVVTPAAAPVQSAPVPAPVQPAPPPAPVQPAPPPAPVQPAPAPAPAQKPVELLWEYTEMMFQANIPLALESTALILDRNRNQLFARCTFRSFTDKSVMAAMIEISCQDIWGTSLGEPISFQYLDLRTKRGSKFGQTTPIELPNPETRRIRVSVKKLLFSDHTLAIGGDEVCTLNAPQPLVQYFKNNDLVTEFTQATTPKAQYAPEFNNICWRCTCGSINTDSDAPCPVCGCTKQLLAEASDPTLLTAKLEDRRARQKAAEEKARQEAEERRARQKAAEEKARQEAEERRCAEAAKRAAEAERRREEEEKARKEREERAKIHQASQEKMRKKKMTVVLCIALAFVIVLGCLGIFLGLPYLNYRKACNMLDNGQYDEARQAFVDLNGFMNSEEMAQYSLYQKAQAALADKQYDIAHDLFLELGNYMNSAVMAKTAMYQKATDALASQEFDAARNIFLELGTYLDSAEMAQEALYQKGVSLMENNMFVQAIELFTSLGKYSDSETMVLETKYRRACYNLTTKTYSQAIAFFEEILGYKDSNSKLNQAKYGYVLAHKNNNDMSTFRYLTDLKKSRYRDSENIYNDLYSWKVVVLGWNSDKDSKVYYNSISRHDPVFCHFKVTGGTPGGTTTIHITGRLPNGTSVEYVFKYSVNDGWVGWYGWEDGLYTYPQYGDIGTVKLYFYDSDGKQIGTSSVKIDR